MTTAKHSYNGCKDNKYNNKDGLDHDNNEGVNDNVPYYHHGYTQSNSNYGKGYPGFASDHHYHHRQLNHDYANDRHSCFIAINGPTAIHIANLFRNTLHDPRIHD